jgi:pimeloyl-ACP methyl ester carboxylesterase
MVHRASQDVRHVLTDDGRTLAVECAGDPGGYPVFLLHGTPGSRSGPRPRGPLLYRLGLLLISYDRPGYGESTPFPGRTVADAAADVVTIADKLGLNNFAVIGRSGGGPHALACAALVPRRVSCAAALVSLAPADAVDLDWYEGMGRHNVDEYTTADADRAELFARLTSSAELTQHDPRRFLRLLLPGITADDRQIVDDVAFRRLLSETYQEATRQGASGWIDDVLALRGAWGVPFAEVRCPVLLWHGSDDHFSPVEHTLWLHRRLPTSELTVAPGVGHFGAMEVLPDILARIARQTGWRGKPARESAGRSGDTTDMIGPPVSTGHADRSSDRATALPAAT